MAIDSERAGTGERYGSTINGVITQQLPRSGRRRRKKLPSRRQLRALLVINAAIGLALIVAVWAHALLSVTPPRVGRPAPAVTVSVPQPQPTVTVTVPRPAPTVTVTELRPGPTITVRCRHPGRRCSGA